MYTKQWVRNCEVRNEYGCYLCKRSRRKVRDHSPMGSAVVQKWFDFQRWAVRKQLDYPQQCYETQHKQAKKYAVHPLYAFDEPPVSAWGECCYFSAQADKDGGNHPALPCIVECALSAVCRNSLQIADFMLLSVQTAKNMFHLFSKSLESASKPN